MPMRDGVTQYDKKTKKFFIKKNKLSLKKFKEAYNRDGRPIAIGLSVVYGDRVYQYIEIGEEHCKEYFYGYNKSDFGWDHDGGLFQWTGRRIYFN